MRTPPETGRAVAPSVNLNLNVRGLTPSATLAINERCAQLAAEGRDVIKLGLGQSPFPVPDVVVEALKRNAHQKDYLPVRGLTVLREAVAQYHRQKHGIAREGEQVIVGPGSKELMFLIQLVYYGDLCIPTPSWVSYEPQARIIGRRVHWLRTTPRNHWGLQPEELEELCEKDPESPRLLILNYPNNPTGFTYERDKLRALAECARRYRVVMLSDEIYGEVHHTGRHRSIAEFYPEGTIISTGLSKWCGAGGWRLGTFTFPDNLKWLLEAMAVVASETFTSTSAPIQFAAVRAFQGGTEIDEYLVQSRRVLRALGTYCAGRLRASGVRVGDPDGAFYLFPDFGAFRTKMNGQGIKTSSDLCERLLEDAGVATIPGASFGRRPRELTLRLSYVDFDGETALADASTRADDELNESFVRERCPKIHDAVERIGNWVSSF